MMRARNPLYQQLYDALPPRRHRIMRIDVDFLLRSLLFSFSSGLRLRGGHHSTTTERKETLLFPNPIKRHQQHTQLDIISAQQGQIVIRLLGLPRSLSLPLPPPSNSPLSLSRTEGFSTHCNSLAAANGTKVYVCGGGMAPVSCSCSLRRATTSVDKIQHKRV